MVAVHRTASRPKSSPDSSSRDSAVVGRPRRWVIEARRIVDSPNVKEQAAEICPVCKTGTLVVVGPARLPNGRQGVRLQCDSCGNVAVAEIGPLYRATEG